MNKIILISSDAAFRNSFRKKEAFINTDNQIVLDTGEPTNAINYLQEFPVDIVFIEMCLPISRSLSFIQSIIALQPTLKVIPIGTSQSFEIAMAAMRSGAFDYLVEPLDDLQLAAVFSRIQSQVLPQPEIESFPTANEYTALLHLLLERDDKFIDFLDKLFYKAEINRKMKDYDIQLSFHKLFHRLLDDCKATYPFIMDYYSSRDIDCLSPNHIYSLQEQENLILHISQELLDIITHFHLSTSSELIQNVNSYVWAHVEDDISLEKLAEYFYVNKSYLSHLFKMETGRTFMHYYTEIRMLRSRILLLEHHKIYECALTLGYEDTEYFSKIFKNYYGCRPTEYMALLDNQAFRYIGHAVDQQ